VRFSLFQGKNGTTGKGQVYRHSYVTRMLITIQNQKTLVYNIQFPEFAHQASHDIIYQLVED
jgi:hypothetical protein